MAWTTRDGEVKKGQSSLRNLTTIGEQNRSSIGRTADITRMMSAGKHLILVSIGAKSGSENSEVLEKIG
jgi:hypothetical protein